MHTQLAASPICVDVPCTVTYLVAIARAGALTLPHPPIGFEPDQPVRTIDIAGFSALVIDVPAAYFTGPEAEARLADLEWLAPRAIRHEELVRHAMQTGPILPVPLGAVFSSPAVLGTTIARHEAAIDSYLTRVARCHEFGVRIAFDRSTFMQRVIEELCAERAVPATPGARYLFDKKVREEASRDVAARLRARTAVIHSALMPHCRDAVERTAVAARPGTLETAAVLAYLVPHDNVDAFRAAIDNVASQHAPHGVTIELSGPWPTYSFCPTLGGST